ncbi:hypothetical protein PTKIN_Ptkin09bG0281700 [Pterospermum kingtungense]
MEGEFSSDSVEVVMETIPSGQLKNPIPNLVFKENEGLVVESGDVVMATGLNEDVDAGAYQHGSSFSERKLSFRDKLMGGQGRHENFSQSEEEGFVSDDDEVLVDEDEEDCPTIGLTKREKERIRRPWRQTLIVKVMGRSVGFNFLLRRIKS